MNELKKFHKVELEPMSASSVDSKMSRGRGLLPRLSRKSLKSQNQSFQSSTVSAFNRNADIDPSDPEACRPEACTKMGISSNDSDNVNESVQPKWSVEFVSARKYMNPTLNLLNDHLPQNNAVTTSIRPMHGSMQFEQSQSKTKLIFHLHRRTRHGRLFSCLQ